MRTILSSFLIILTVTLNSAAGFFGNFFSGAGRKEMQYGATADEKADLYLLSGRDNPAVIFIHGGAWAGGDKSFYASYYAKKYAAAGLSVVALNYRLVKAGDPATQWPAQLQDAQLAIRWVRANAGKFGIDPDRICLFGDSAGGHIATFAGALDERMEGDRSELYADMPQAVSCVVNMFGPSDFTDPEQLKVLNNLALLGGQSYAQAPELYENASPVNAITGRSAPVLMIQGLQDKIVPPSQAARLDKKLNSAHVPHPPIEYFNGGHWFADPPVRPSSKKNEIDDRALAFILGYLRPGDKTAEAAPR